MAYQFVSSGPRRHCGVSTVLQYIHSLLVFDFLFCFLMGRRQLYSPVKGIAECFIIVYLRMMRKRKSEFQKYILSL